CARAGRNEVATFARQGTESLTAYLDAAKPDDAFRADAELLLGRGLLMLTSSEPGQLDPAIAHLAKAVELLQKDGRPDAAGRGAYQALAKRAAAGRAGDARKFAQDVQAATADFGTSTTSVRTLAASAAVAPGFPLPKLPEAAGVDGAPLGLNERGHPLLLHF